MNVTLKPEFLNKAVYHCVVARDLGQEYTPEEIGRMIAEGSTI